jgi:hypothetical protein
MISQQDLTIIQGDDFAQIVAIPGASTPDLIGYSAQAQLRRGAADWNYLVVEMGASVLPTQASAVVSIPRSETVLLYGWYVWDLQLVAPAGDITTVLGGRVQVIQEVTRE